jgi:hypothetical protein
MSEDWLQINSEPSWTVFVKNARSLYDQHKFVTFGRPRLGKDRSIPQNKLFHVFCTEWAAHALDKTKKQVTKGELRGMKDAVKKNFYLETGHHWMLIVSVNPLTSEAKTKWESSREWSVPQMYEVLTWMQAEAANNGLVLVAKGEFQRELEKQNS